MSQYNNELEPGQGKVFGPDPNDHRPRHPKASHFSGTIKAHRDIAAGEEVSLSVWDQGEGQKTGRRWMTLKMDDGPASRLARAAPQMQDDIPGQHYGEERENPEPLPERYQPRRPAGPYTPRPDQGAGPAPARPAYPPRPTYPPKKSPL